MEGMLSLVLADEIDAALGVAEIMTSGAEGGGSDSEAKASTVVLLVVETMVLDDNATSGI